jgi:hypothetical protein
MGEHHQRAWLFDQPRAALRPAAAAVNSVPCSTAVVCVVSCGAAAACCLVSGAGAVLLAASVSTCAGHRPPQAVVCTGCMRVGSACVAAVREGYAEVVCVAVRCAERCSWGSWQEGRCRGVWLSVCARLPVSVSGIRSPHQDRAVLSGVLCCCGQQLSVSGLCLQARRGACYCRLQHRRLPAAWQHMLCILFSGVVQAGL